MELLPYTYIEEKQRGLFITIGPDIRATRHGRLLPCPMAKAAHRVAMLIGRPGAQLAKALSDAHDYYTHSPDIEAHREFQRRVWNWTIAARQVGNTLIGSLGGDIAQKVGYTFAPVPPPFVPPEPELPKPDCGDLCKLIGNGCKAPRSCYTTATRVHGPGLVVESDLSIWWWDSGVYDTVCGVFFPTGMTEIRHRGDTLYPNSGFYCALGAHRDLGSEVVTCNADMCIYTSDFHRYLFVDKGTQVVGPGVLRDAGKLYYIDKTVVCPHDCFFWPVR